MIRVGCSDDSHAGTFGVIGTKRVVFTLLEKPEQLDLCADGKVTYFIKE
jgi:hypothetical protein